MISGIRCCRTLIHNSLRLAPFSCQVQGGYSRYTSTLVHQASASTNSSYEEEEEEDIMDWDKLGFSLVTTDYMYMMKCGRDGSFDKGQLNPFGNIQLSPASGVLNYGQGLFEGTKAYRKEDGGILLFRPELNAMRMQKGAERMCMPCPTIQQFIESVKQTALANNRWVPPVGKGTLYIRPMLLGSGAALGVAPAPDYTFLVYASPVGNYFKDKNAGSLNLYVEEDYDRSSRLGTGGVKAIGNYAPVLKAVTKAKSKGFSDVLFLDSVEKKNVEEASACNIFMVKGNVITTPAAEGTILPGVTRKSIIELARDNGYQVQEGVVGVDKLLEADEVFCTGTAVVVSPVASITYRDQRVEYKTGEGSVSWELYSTLLGIQTGVIQDTKGWTLEIN
ncbi:Branched-chain-amino-acid aminotransferase 2, chloroplastic [Linum grandiflorum]